MKLSFSTLGCPNYSVDQIIAMAVENGYEGLELRAVSGTVDLWKLPEFSGSGLAETAKKFKEHGLKIACIGSNIRFSEGKEQKNAQMETAKAYIEILKALDCPYLRAFGGPLVPTLGYLKSVELIREGYEELCALTGEAGVMPLLETHDDFSTSARTLDVLGGLSSKNVGVVWDILHPIRFGEALEDTFAALKDYVRHVHVKDSTDYSPKGFDLVLVGNGKVPVGDIVKLLKNKGYEGYLSFEWEKMWHPEIEEPEIAIPHYAKAMKSLA